MTHSKETSQILEYQARIRRLPAIQDILQGMPSISFPIAGEIPNTLNYFVYPESNFDFGKSQIGRPYAHFSINLPNFELGTIMQGEHAFTFENSIQFPFVFERNVQKETVNYELDIFFSIYQTVLNTYPGKPPTFIIERFHKMFVKFVPQQLFPFYKSLNPKFFAYFQNSNQTY